ncbi:MAG: hypothetical protein DWP97_04745 [Calditrichaeota bacterium]|nr:MAG: hypothetical protein DWP97_04745 [Calditrichota bacterium]
MANSEEKIKCFIASFQHKKMDPGLSAEEVSNGLIAFSVPQLGLLFRCQSEGEPLKMEFSSFFALLEFLKTKVKDIPLNSLEVLSSNPHFVFSFSPYSETLKKGSVFRNILNEYSKIFKISVGYIKPLSNKALISTTEYPSIPQDKKIELDFTTEELFKIEFKPIQKGIKL